MNRGVKLAIAAGVVVIIAGCKVDQQKEMATYQAITHIPYAQTPTTRPADKPLTLLEAVILANEYNERLAIEGETYLQAIIARKRSVALFLPMADLSGTYTMADKTSGVDSETFDLAAVGRINVFNGFRDVARLRYSDLTIEQQRLALLDVQESLLADVVRAFHAVLRAEEETKVLENSLTVQDARVRDVRARQQAGTARPLDVAQSQAQASATKVRLINSRDQAKNARAALAFLTNASVDNAKLYDAGLPQFFVGSLEELRDAALAMRNDLAAAKKARMAARQNVEVAFGQYYPSASVNLRYFLERQTEPSDRNWDSFIQLNMPIFSAGLIEADVREAWSKYRQTFQFESLLQRQILRDVDTAEHDFRASLERIEELRVQLNAADLAFRQAEASFDAGLATNLERLTAQDQMLSASLQLVAETYNQRVYYADLLRATGGLREFVEKHVAAAATQPATTQPASLPFVK